MSKKKPKPDKETIPPSIDTSKTITLEIIVDNEKAPISSEEFGKAVQSLAMTLTRMCNVFKLKEIHTSFKDHTSPLAIKKDVKIHVGFKPVVKKDEEEPEFPEDEIIREGHPEDVDKSNGTRSTDKVL